MYLTIFSTFKDRCYSVIYLTYYVSPQCSISRYNMLWFQFYFDITLLYRDEIFYLDVTLLHLDDIFYLDITFLYFGEIFYLRIQLSSKARDLTKKQFSISGQFLNRQRLAVNLSGGLQILLFLYLYISGKHLSNFPHYLSKFVISSVYVALQLCLALQFGLLTLWPIVSVLICHQWKCVVVVSSRIILPREGTSNWKFCSGFSPSVSQMDSLRSPWCSRPWVYR